MVSRVQNTPNIINYQTLTLSLACDKKKRRAPVVSGTGSPVKELMPATLSIGHQWEISFKLTLRLQ